MIIYLGFLWATFIIGIGVGWIWKPPKWVGFNRSKFVFNSPLQQPSSPSSSSSRSSPVKGFGSAPCLLTFVDQSEGADEVFDKRSTQVPAMEKPDFSLQELEEEKSLAVKEEDLEHLSKLVEMKDGGPSWTPMMERTTPSMSYEAWQRLPNTGPPQYRSRSVYEDTTPELLRDFFWDDEFRLKWDDMLLYSETVEECPKTGTMVVHWIRKFPVFCSDRDYTIGRRIWAAGDSYYCVTKGVPCPSIPKRNKPRRVDLYYSSWCIRAVESRKGNGQKTACEVILFHHEDMGIPWEIAKYGVRQGMWGAVKKIANGLCAYQKERSLGTHFSPQVIMAQINTKIDKEYLTSSIEKSYDDSVSSESEKIVETKKNLGSNIPKLLVIGGAFVLACSLDRGLLPKAVIFSVGRRFANLGRRLPLN